MEVSDLYLDSVQVFGSDAIEIVPMKNVTSVGQLQNLGES